MDEEKQKSCECSCCDWKKMHRHHHRGCGGGCGVYGLGVVGVLFYYLPHCVTFSDYAWGIFKALVWPAYLIFKAYTMLKM